MRTTLIIVLVIFGTSHHAFSQPVWDSLKLEKNKVEKTIEKIKNRPELKNSKGINLTDLTFVYPDKIRSGDKFFDIEVKWKGETILIYGIDPDIYEVGGEIIDLR